MKVKVIMGGLQFYVKEIKLDSLELTEYRSQCKDFDGVQKEFLIDELKANKKITGAYEISKQEGILNVIKKCNAN